MADNNVGGFGGTNNYVGGDGIARSTFGNASQTRQCIEVTKIVEKPKMASGPCYVGPGQNMSIPIKPAPVLSYPMGVRTLPNRSSNDYKKYFGSVCWKGSVSIAPSTSVRSDEVFPFLELPLYTDYERVSGEGQVTSKDSDLRLFRPFSSLVAHDNGVVETTGGFDRLLNTNNIGRKFTMTSLDLVGYVETSAQYAGGAPGSLSETSVPYKLSLCNASGEEIEAAIKNTDANANDYTSISTPYDMRQRPQSQLYSDIHSATDVQIQFPECSIRQSEDRGLVLRLYLPNVKSGGKWRFLIDLSLNFTWFQGWQPSIQIYPRMITTKKKDGKMCRKMNGLERVQTEPSREEWWYGQYWPYKICRTASYSAALYFGVGDKVKSLYNAPMGNNLPTRNTLIKNMSISKYGSKAMGVIGTDDGAQVDKGGAKLARSNETQNRLLKGILDALKRKVAAKKKGKGKKAKKRGLSKKAMAERKKQKKDAKKAMAKKKAGCKAKKKGKKKGKSKSSSRGSSVRCDPKSPSVSKATKKKWK